MSAEAWTPSHASERTLDESDAIDQLQANCWPYETMDDPAATRSRAADALEHLVELGLPCSVASGRRLFEPYEVINFLVWTHVRRGDPLWAESAVVAQRRMVREHADGRDRRVTVAVDRHLVAHGTPGALVRTQLPLEIDVAGQSDAVVRVRAGPGVDAARAGDRVDGRMRVGAMPALDVGYDIELRCSWRGDVVEPDRVEPFRDADPSMAPWLSASEGPIQVTSRVRSLADRLADGASTPWEALRAFWSHLFATITFGYVHYDRLQGPDVLSAVVDLGRADCWHATALLCGLCRARGIPARMVGGLPLYSAFSAQHYWCEVHVPPYGWLPCDLTLSWVCARGRAGDSTWSDTFLGRLDPRLALESFPRQRLLIGPRLPKRFFHQLRSTPSGTEATFHDRDTGAIVYRDLVRVAASAVLA